MVCEGLNRCRHQCRKRRPIALKCSERRLRRKPRVESDGRAIVQGWRCLDIEAANVKQRQYCQDMIRRTEVMHVLTHDPIPQQRVLP